MNPLGTTYDTAKDKVRPRMPGQQLCLAAIIRETGATNKAFIIILYSDPWVKGVIILVCQGELCPLTFPWSRNMANSLYLSSVSG